LITDRQYSSLVRLRSMAPGGRRRSRAASRDTDHVTRRGPAGATGHRSATSPARLLRPASAPAREHLRPPPAPG